MRLSELVVPAYPQIRFCSPQLPRALDALERHLAGLVQAIHLFGSAVDGGLRPLSDIDLLVTVDGPLADPVRRALAVDLLAVSGPPGGPGPWRPLEVTVLVRDDVVPWRYPPMRELQFGEWLRDDIRGGRIPPRVADHDLAILLAKARRRSVALVGPPAASLFDPVPRADLSRSLRDTAAQWNTQADWAGDERNVVLALARVWFSASTGGIASKDAAAAWALERLPREHRPVLERARHAYLSGADDRLASSPAALDRFVRNARAAIDAVLDADGA